MRTFKTLANLAPPQSHANAYATFKRLRIRAHLHIVVRKHTRTSKHLQTRARLHKVVRTSMCTYKHLQTCTRLHKVARTFNTYELNPVPTESCDCACVLLETLKRLYLPTNSHKHFCVPLDTCVRICVL